MEERINRLERELVEVKNRNLRVEIDKAWETSIFRIGTIVVITYVVASIVLHLIGVNNYFVSALIPTIGYFLSVQSLPFIKKWWISKNTFNK